MAHFYLQGLLLLFVLMLDSECKDVSTVIASQEKDVTLPCLNSTGMGPKSCNRIKWIKCATDFSQVKVILARPETPDIPDAERVKWEVDKNGGMSLFLTKVQKSDEGLYRCEIWQGWDIVFVKKISLKVKECTAASGVKAALGEAVRLSCPVDRTSGQQGQLNISWVMLKGGQPVSPVKVNIKDTFLNIQSVDYNNHGWYRCNYTMGQTQHCFDIHLQVQENAVLTSAVPGINLNTIRAQTTSEITLEMKAEGRSGTFTLLVSIIISAAVFVALTGLFVYNRCNVKSDAQQTPRHSSSGTQEDDDYHEYVDLGPTEEERDQHQPFQDHSLCTFS